MCGPTPYGHDGAMSSSLHVLAAQEHFADLRRTSGERRFGRSLARRAERARARRGAGVRRGMRVLRPAI